MRLSVSIFALLVMCSSAIAQDQTADQFKISLENAVKELAQGIGRDDSQSFRALLRLTPRDDDGSYLIEGDIGVSEVEYAEYILRYAKGDQLITDDLEIDVNLHNGALDYFAASEDRILPFAVVRSSFSTVGQYQEVVTLFNLAASDWEKACPECGIDFVHVKDKDDQAAPQGLNFIVRMRDGGGFYAARAPFPHKTGSDRVVRIDPTFFTHERPHDGILRHEIGHILGFRHAHANGVPGCKVEKDQMVALTEYDKRSIMHYFCGGGGNDEMTLTELDIVGFRKLYLGLQE